MSHEQEGHARQSFPRRSFARILSPTTLTQESDLALRYAVALARAYEAKLYLCYCASRDKHDQTPPPEHPERVFIESLAPYVTEEDNQSLSWEGIITHGDPASAITVEATARDVELIVMSSRHRPLAATLIGSTAEAISRLATCPVLVTHPREREWVNISNGEIQLKRVLVPYDFSKYSDDALHLGVSLAEEFQAELHMLHIMPSRAEGTWYPADENVYEQIRRKLRYVVPAEAENWCVIKQDVREGKTYREILAYADENDIDLICMGAQGTGFGEWSLFGSNTDRVLRQATCPVLVARAQNRADVYVEAEAEQAAKDVVTPAPEAAQQPAEFLDQGLAQDPEPTKD